MSDRDVATLYIAEMRALIPVLRTHLATLGAQLPSPQRSVAAEELGRLSVAAADLSADFRADDCAALAATLSRAFPQSPDAYPGATILAAAADTLTYIGGRIEKMDTARRILAPTESERAAVARLLTALAAASGQSVSAALTALTPADLDGAPLYDPVPTSTRPEEGQSRVDPGRPLPPPVTSWLPSRDDAQVLPVREPADPQLAPTKQLEHRRGAGAPTARSAPSAGKQIQEDTALTRPALPVTTDKLSDLDGIGQEEPARVELSDEDLAILHAFRTQPLRHGTRPLVSRTDAERPADSDDLGEIKPEWRSVFVFETEQDLKDMQNGLAAIEQYPQDRTRLAAMVRTVHKIKGSAATLNFPYLAELAHAYEDQLGTLRSQQVPADGQTVALLVRGLGELERALAGIARGEAEDSECVVRMGAITGALHERSAESPLPPRRAAADADSGAETWGATSQALERAIAVAPEPSAQAPMSAELASAGSLSSLVSGGDIPLRVEVRRLDDLMNGVSALAMNRAEIAQVRQVASETQGDMERAIARLSELSARLAALRPAAGAAIPSPAQVEPLKAGFMGRLLGGDRHAQTRPLVDPVATAVRTQPMLRRDLDLEQYTEYDHLVRALAEAVSDVATSAAAVSSTLNRLDRLDQTQENLAASIQESVNQMRLVPLSNHVPRLVRAVRVLAAQLGKRVTVAVRGEMTEIDRDVSEALAESLLQLMRNAVVHGIERTDERVILGKPAEGTIWLQAYYTGSDVNIEIGDDGRGINPDKVKASALVQGIIDQDEVRRLDDRDALKLIFEQGVSGAEELSTAAGRGVGMAEVAESIARLRGAIEVRSQPGEGTTFRIRVPISLSIVRALHVRAGGQEYAVPFASVLQTMPLPIEAGALAPTREGEQSEQRTLTLQIGEREVSAPIYPLDRLLGLPGGHAPQQVALVVEMGRRYAACSVESVVTDREIVVRSLPPHLRRRAVRGAAVTPTGKVLLVLDLPQLLNRLNSEGHLGIRRTPAVPRLVPAPLPRILVADDSLSIRQALSNALSHAGFATQTARDGMEALEMLLESLPALVVLDIEMPRLDGYELLSVMRSHAQLAKVPVVMLTSRGAQVHRQYAESLGANAYLVKPCPDEDLVAAIRRLVDSTA